MLSSFELVSYCQLALIAPQRSSGGRLHRRNDIAREAVLAREFLLGLCNPGGKSLLAHHADRDRHESVVLAAQFRALAVIDALAVRLEPGLVEAAGNGVDLDAERRHR